MDKERVKTLKAGMRKVMKHFPIAIKSDENCPHCGKEFVKTVSFLDYILHLIESMENCPICGKPLPTEDADDLDVIPFKSYLDNPKYKDLFVGTYNTIINGMCSWYGYADSVEDGMPRFISTDDDVNGDKFEACFGRKDYFSHAIVEIHTAFEVFLSYLVCQDKLIEACKTGSLDNLKREKISDDCKKLLEMIQDGKIKSVDPDLEYMISYKLRLTDLIHLLDAIGIKKKDFFKVNNEVGTIRNGIAHRGYTANFEDYVNAFIAVGDVIVKYG